MKTTLCGPLALVLQSLVAVAALAGCEPSSSPTSSVPATGTEFAPDAAAASPTMSTTPDGGTTAPGSGKTWGAAVEISSGTVTNLRGSPQVGLDAAGNAIAVWQEALADHTRNGVWASRYSAGGAWSTPATIDNPVGSASAPKLAMTPSGTTLVAFGQSDSNQGGTQLLVTNRFTGAWGTPTTIATPGQTPDKPFVALGPDGVAAAVFTASDGTFPRAWVARASAGGPWDVPVAMVSNVQPGWAPSVTVGANGDTVMTWTETDGGLSATSLWASRNQSGMWSAPVRLTVDGGTVLGSVALGADADGDVLALWSQRLGGLYTLRSSRMSGTTGAWSVPVTVNDGTREVTAPHLSVDADGDGVAVWFETSYGVVASRFSSSTATWGSPAVLQAKSTGLLSFPIPHVGLDDQGNAVATWVQTVGSPPAPHLFAAHSSAASGTWTAPIDMLGEPSPTPYADETHLSVNAKGEAVLVWHQDTGASSAPSIWARVYR